MGNFEKLPWFLRVMYLLPIVLVIIATVYLDIDYTKFEHAPSSPVLRFLKITPGEKITEEKSSSKTTGDEVSLGEETRRGEEILKEYKEQEGLS